MPYSIVELETMARQHREALLREAERPPLAMTWRTKSLGGGLVRLKRRTGLILIVLGERLGGREAIALPAAGRTATNGGGW